MKEVSVECRWSAGRGDGDSYVDDYELEDEEYNLLNSYFRTHYSDEITSEDIEDLKVKELVKRIEEETEDTLKENSRDGFESLEVEEDFEDWYDDFDTSVQLLWDEPEEYSFMIHVENGNDFEINFNLFEEEYDLLSEEDNPLENEDLDSFNKDITEVIKNKLKEMKLDENTSFTYELI